MWANQLHRCAIEVMDFALDELIRCPAKKRKIRKWKRDSGKAEAKKAGAIVINGAPTFLESIAEEVSRLLAMEPKASDPIKRWRLLRLPR